MPRRTKLSPEEKANLVQRCLSEDFGVLEAARLVGVDLETVRKWVSQYAAEGKECFFPQKPRGGGIMRLILEELELSLEKVNSTPAVEIFLLKVALTNSKVSKIH